MNGSRPEIKQSFKEDPAVKAVKYFLERTVMHEMEEINAGFSGPEMAAILPFEILRWSEDLDFANVVVKGEQIEAIEARKLWAYIPGNYNSAEEAVKARANIPPSVYSNLKDLYLTIFPYFENALGISARKAWEEIGKSNLRELVPTLKALILEQTSDKRSVNVAVERIFADVDETISVSGEDVTGDERKARAVETTLEWGRGTNKQLRESLRPEETLQIIAYHLRLNGRRWVLMDIEEEDQFEILSRTFGKYMNICTINLQHERGGALSLPTIRALLGKKETENG